jgi:hypothetical protein
MVPSFALQTITNIQFFFTLEIGEHTKTEVADEIERTLISCVADDIQSFSSGKCFWGSG